MQTLDGKDRSGIIWREGKGTEDLGAAVLRFVRFPDLPAGTTADDSDPMRTG